MVTRDECVIIRIDGGQAPSAVTVGALGAACDGAEDRGVPLVIYLSGAPRGPWAGGVDVALVSKWERGVRRLERLRATSVAVAAGDCGGSALDALLATDYRIVATSLRLLVQDVAGATWPGMALYRLTRQAGTAAIRRAALFGAPIAAAEAQALHLVDEVTDDLDGALAASAALTGALSGPEVCIRRQLMLEATATSFEDALGTHLAACDRALRRASALSG